MIRVNIDEELNTEVDINGTGTNIMAELGVLVSKMLEIGILEEMIDVAVKSGKLLYQKEKE